MVIKMNKKKLTLVGTDVDEIRDIVGGIVKDEFRAEEDRKKKEKHINKVLKKDEMLDKKRRQIDVEVPKVEVPKVEAPEVEKPKKHVHSCPSCNASFEKIDDGFEICKDCGTADITLKKGQKMAICNNCGGVIPESFIGVNKNCPHCDSNVGAHWAK